MTEKRTSVNDIRLAKGKEPLVCLTAYTAPFARILDAHADILLVGDSLGMVLYGMESTLPVTLEMMIQHGKAVVKSSKNALVVVDLPFGTYQASEAQAFESAARMLAETGCQAVKLEGGVEMASTVEHLVKRGIPVMGHVGLMPQRVNIYGGYGCRGKTREGRKSIVEDAVAVEKAGAFAVVIEGVVESLGKEVTQKIQVPTIGIGASPACDGQVLVSEDMAGLFTEFTPRFVQRYGNLAENLDNAAEAFSKDVRSRKFPTEKHCF